MLNKSTKGDRGRLKSVYTYLFFVGNYELLWVIPPSPGEIAGPMAAENTEIDLTNTITLKLV